VSAPTTTWLVLYDGDCGFCKWLLALLLRRDRAARLRPVALQSPAAENLLSDLDAEQRLASWHLISPAGERRSGGAALPTLLELLPGGRPLAAPLTRFPRLTDRGYRWVAGNRVLLSKPVPARSKRRASAEVRRRELESAGD
jgi:predicted DCC family thiol-disulfide oxidoreductase YuxK